MPLSAANYEGNSQARDVKRRGLQGCVDTSRCLRLALLRAHVGQAVLCRHKSPSTPLPALFTWRLLKTDRDDRKTVEFETTCLFCCSTAQAKALAANPTCQFEPHKHASSNRLPFCQPHQLLLCCSGCHCRLARILRLQALHKRLKAGTPPGFGQQLMEHHLHDTQDALRCMCTND